MSVTRFFRMDRMFSEMNASDAVARAMPRAAFSSSTAPMAAIRGWILGTRRPYISPVVPEFPVLVTMLIIGSNENEENGEQCNMRISNRLTLNNVYRTIPVFGHEIQF